MLVINPIIAVAGGSAAGARRAGCATRRASIMFFLIGAGGDLGYAVGLLQQFVVYVVSIPGGIIWDAARVRQGAPVPDVMREGETK
ncbi:MAG: hypothetical protein R3A10_14870 [Caldilineaceae bacterium]